ncbi:MAG: sensor histidine kinase [Thermodesulfobacteriota bacterium]
MSLKPLKNFFKTISFRLTLWYSGIFFLSFSILFGLTYFLLSSSLKEYDRDMIQTKLRDLSILYEAGGMEDLQKEVSSETESIKKDPFLIRIASDKNDTLFLNFPYHGAEFDLRLLEKIPLSFQRQWIILPLEGGRIIFEIATTELLDGNFLQVGKSNKDREKILSHFREIFTIAIFPLVFLGISGGVFLSIRALRPIRHLIQAVRSIVTGNLEARVPSPQTGDELDELVHLFNGMLEKIESLIKGLRGSLDNVAHDLRTPMARLRVDAEMALQSGENIERFKEALSNCIEESDQILRMLNTLMDISEAETGTMKLDLKEINLSTIIDETVEVYSYLAEERDIKIEKNIPKTLFLKVDPNRLRQVFGNLLDNAVKYSNSGGNIYINAYLGGGETIIAVKDKGIGIPPEDLPKIWDRLFRGDKSRSKRGLGLGLSLVKAVVEAHGGRVEVTSEPGKGSEFKIYIPLSF